MVAKNVRLAAPDAAVLTSTISVGAVFGAELVARSFAGAFGPCSGNPEVSILLRSSPFLPSLPRASTMAKGSA